MRAYHTKAGFTWLLTAILEFAVALTCWLWFDYTYGALLGFGACAIACTFSIYYLAKSLRA